MNTNTLPSTALVTKKTPLLVATLALCLVYAIVGYLALKLAIPPGYATAIFPPAGIALAALLIWGYRLWPAVFLGSLLLNSWVSMEHSTPTLVNYVFLISASTGATLQALVGAWLVHRFVGFPNSLSKEKDIFKFMLLAGPVAALINASFGVTSLYATGIISLSDYAYSWLTWWTGDSIGILITSPLMLIAFGQPHKLWRSRYKSVAFPLILLLCIVIAVFIWVSKLELEKTHLDFKEISTHSHQQLRSSFESYLDSVAYIQQFFSSSSEVTRKDFKLFVDYALESKKGIQALSWNPVILETQRQQFEKRVIDEGFHSFKITERNANGDLIQALKRELYVPVKFIEPMIGNENAFGFDVFSNAERRKALLEAQNSGETVATEKIKLVQKSGEQTGFLIFKPVYLGGKNYSIKERSKNLKGFAVGAFKVDGILNDVLKNQFKEQVNLSIHDISDGKHILIYETNNINKSNNAQFKITDTLDIGGRTWVMNYWPSDNYIASHRSWQSWAVLAIGLLFTSFLGAFLLAMTGRTNQIENLVEQRTSELSGVLNSAIEAIMTIDENGNVVTINPAGEKLFGYSSLEISEKPIHKIIPEFFTPHNTKIEDFPEMSATGVRRDSYALHKNNKKIPIELATSTLLINNKTLYTAIIHDLTERTKVERMKDEFISIISHELRTPITSIKGALGLINGGVVDNNPEKMKQMVKISYENCSRLEVLINDLLDFNKNNSLENTLNLHSININDLINKATESNQGYADKYDVVFKWAPDKTDVFINGDENKLMQVFANLLSNAVKYSPKGSDVVISTDKQNNNQVRISISDSGSGIPLDFQDKVFEKFTQADSSDTRRVGGTGLGMAITKSIIEKHGGHISFDSTPGKGTIFYIDLPISKKQSK